MSSRNRKINCSVCVETETDRRKVRRATQIVGVQTPGNRSFGFRRYVCDEHAAVLIKAIEDAQIKPAKLGRGMSD